MPIAFTNQHLCGLLPEFFDGANPASAALQLHHNYAHGGGVSPFRGFTMHKWQEPGQAFLSYPDDPPMREVGRAKLRDETIILFQNSWVALIGADGTHIITRCD